MTKDRPAYGKRAAAPGYKNITPSLAALAVLLMMPDAAKAQTVLPPDVKPSCAVSAPEFNGWFAMGSPAKDGIVLPANSLAFTAGPNDRCPFFKWSEQMFLWLASPLGPGRHVFASPQFYSVEALGADGRRGLVPQDNNTPLNFAPAISLVGAKGVDDVVDSTGKIRNVVHVRAPGSTLMFRDKSDRPVDVARVAAATSGKPLLLDSTNKVLDVLTAENGAPLLRDAAGKTVNLADSTVLVDGVQRLVTTAGDVVEIGQAGGNAVLMTRNSGLVYYLLQVNDVFAYFNTGMTDGKFSAPVPTEFPAAADLLDKITDLAKNAPPPHTKPGFMDRIALAMELKSSWVEASKVSDPQNYLTIKAIIPKFVPGDGGKLVHSGTTNVDLALVGFHVVGSTLGHPEMIWATFEHVSNTPNQPYSYKTVSDGSITAPADGAGSWLFSSAGASSTQPPTRMTAQQNGAEILPANGQTIGPVNVTRLNPWGTPAADNAAVETNTDIISINRSVVGQMPAGDVRANYIMIGSTWTSDGKMPVGTNIAGSRTLANSTMETFRQARNCLSCHSGDPLGDSDAGGLSHIWGKIKPLFP
jgi:hypothetical protein